MTARKPTRTAWKPGQSGNPRGKPPGTRNHATRIVEAILASGAEEIAKLVTDLARSGDLTAARFVLERIVPPARERPLSVELPPTDTPEGLNAASQRVVAALAAGDLLPAEAQALTATLETRRKLLETLDLEARIAALEEAHDRTH